MSDDKETFRAERFHWGDDVEFDWHPPVETKDWDEGKHPRVPAGSPDGGQFGGGGGGGDGGGSSSSALDNKSVVAFHGTVESVVSQIMKEGMRVKPGSHHFDGDVYAGERGESVFVTTSQKTAEKYASSLAQSESWAQYKAVAPVMFKLVVPEDEWIKFNKDKLEPESYYTKTIPPEWIAGVFRVGGNPADPLTEYKANHVTAYMVIFVGEPKEDAKAKAAGDWDESEHPRDSDGKFGFGGGGGGDKAPKAPKEPKAPKSEGSKRPWPKGVPKYAHRLPPEDYKGKTIYDEREDPKWLASKPALTGKTELLTVLSKMSTIGYIRHWATTTGDGHPDQAVYVGHSGRVIVDDYTSENYEIDPHQGTENVGLPKPPAPPPDTDATEGDPPQETNRIASTKEAQLVADKKFVREMHFTGDFPNAKTDNLDVIGKSTNDYNCMSYAVGVKDRWWWPGSGAWPKSVSPINEVASFDELMGNFNYTERAVSDSSAPVKYEKGFVKLALYAEDDGTPTHITRLQPNGHWVSKMGGNSLIEHDTLDVIEGESYGNAIKIYRLPTAEWRKIRWMEPRW